MIFATAVQSKTDTSMPILARDDTPPAMPISHQVRLAMTDE